MRNFIKNTIIIFILALGFVGCDDAAVASRNLAKSADPTKPSARMKIIIVFLIKFLMM
jgi:hypothetical protein